MKTDLKKILSISGQPGLFLYLSHANAGAVVESIVTKKRTCCGMSARITALSDISIFTETDEIRLQQVFEKMKAYRTMLRRAKVMQRFLKSFLKMYCQTMTETVSTFHI